MPTADGKLFTVDLRVLVLGVAIQVAGTVEVLDVRKK